MQKDELIEVLTEILDRLNKIERRLNYLEINQINQKIRSELSNNSKFKLPQNIEPWGTIS